MTFRTVACGPEAPLRVVLVGAGGMGRSWLATIAASTDVELAGIADLNLDAARAAAVETGSPDLPTGTDAVHLARRTGAQALINVTTPEAHHPVATAALFAGLPVLGEKPVATNVAEALSLAAAAEVTGELFMVSQSRRWNPQLATLRAMTRQLGAIGTVATEFYKAPRFGGFRDQMDNPLLIDMAIHAFDAARFLLGSEPVAAFCQAYNPSWSWYAGNANALAMFEMTCGTRYIYCGSWCSPGAETSWNGGWRVSGENGTALWNGESDPVLDGIAVTPSGSQQGGSGIDGALHGFVQALRSGESPSGEVHENLMSLAMVEAATESARTGRRALVDDVLDQAHQQALRDELRPEVAEQLASWASVRGALLQQAATM
jgi:predicted dehydrogenase